MNMLKKTITGLAVVSGFAVGTTEAATPLTSVLIKSTAVQLSPTGTSSTPTLSLLPGGSSKIVPTGTKPPPIAPEGCGPRP